MSTAVDYDAATDLMRVDEPTVREALAVGTVLSVGTIVAQGRFVPGGRGCYAGVHVLVHRANMPAQYAYSTHLAYVPSEASGVRRPESQTGHYDMTLDIAHADLAAR